MRLRIQISHHLLIALLLSSALGGVVYRLSILALYREQPSAHLLWSVALSYKKKICRSTFYIRYHFTLSIRKEASEWRFSVMPDYSNLKPGSSSHYCNHNYLSPDRLRQQLPSKKPCKMIFKGTQSIVLISNRDSKINDTCYIYLYKICKITLSSQYLKMPQMNDHK